MNRDILDPVLDELIIKLEPCTLVCLLVCLWLRIQKFDLTYNSDGTQNHKLFL